MLDWSIKLFHIRRISLEMHISFLILPLYFAYTGAVSDGPGGILWGLAFLSCIFACITLHELGHALTARRFGINTERILLLPIGGLAQLESPPRIAKHELLITLAGPAVNFLIAALLMPIFGGPPALEDIPAVAVPSSILDIAFALLIFNLAMGLFNLLPVFPMDGGRLLRSILSFWIQPTQATAIASKIGSFLAMALAVYFIIGPFGVQLQIAAVFIFILMASQMELKAAKRHEAFNAQSVEGHLESDFPVLESNSSIREIDSIWKLRGRGDILVCENGTIIGFAPENAIQLAMEQDEDEAGIKSITSNNLATLQCNDTLKKALQLSIEKQQRLFPVYRYNKFLGILDTRNIE